MSMNKPSGKSQTDFAVLYPVKPVHLGPVANGAFQLKARHGLWLAAIIMLSAGVAVAQSGGVRASAFEILLKWMPLLLKGFIFNLVISVAAMAIGTTAGAALGLGQISLNPIVRRFAWVVTQFFRNSPWLVILFFVMLMLPFELKFGDTIIPLPDWLKATVGLSLPVMANVSEIVRGAVISLPSGQWESAEALAFSRTQTLWRIILPQCIKRMLPPWMNLYAILTMATVLASIVGVSEIMTLTGEVLAAEGGRIDLLIPIYGFVLLLFFMYCYPIARWTLHLEKKFAVKG